MKELLFVKNAVKQLMYLKKLKYANAEKFYCR